MKKIGLWLLLACIGSGSELAVAQTYPSRVVRVVVPIAPGGATDILARAVASRLSERLKQSFIVENRPGGTGTVGSDAVAKSAPDGYTLLMGADTILAINPHVYPNFPFDPVKSLQPITKVADVPLLVVASLSSGLTKLADFNAVAKARNAPLTLSSAGTGSAGHLTGELLKARMGVPITHIPYKSGGQAVADVVGGQVDLLIAAIPASQAFVKSGKVKAVAVTSAKRSGAMPDVATVAESGYKEFDISSWYGLLAPAGTPMPIVRLVQKEVAGILAETEMQDRFGVMGAEPVGNTPEEFAGNIKTDLARWGAVIKSSGIRIE